MELIMKLKLSLISILSTFILIPVAAQAAPGSLSQLPLFVAPPIQPNIFFMLDDSGSMHWNMPVDGLSSSNLISMTQYDTIPDNADEWRTWCSGANLLAYDSTTTYIPWAANIPGTSTPFPDSIDLTNVRVDPLIQSGGSINFAGGANNVIDNDDDGGVDLSAAPVVTWTDINNNGQYDPGECPVTSGDAGWVTAASLPPAQQVNFANWFSYYRLREHTTKAAVTQVISGSSTRMGMATLHSNSGVGSRIEDMTIIANKEALLDDIVNINSSGGTPLRTSLNNVGQYFSRVQSTPSDLNIGSAPSPILPEASGGACQQNFTMLMTDGQWNGNSPGVNHQDDVTNNDTVYPAHRDTTPNTLADVAMLWYKTDLAPSLTPLVPTQSGNNTQNLDQNNDQHMVTFGVAFGPTGTLSADPTDRTQAFSWPVPVSNGLTTVDDLRHAAYNGRGLFLSANRPQELISSLADVISDIESRQGSSSSVAFNMSALSANTVLYFAGFDTTDWSGDLVAYNLDPTTGDISAVPNWSGASLLDARTNLDMSDNRIVYTSGTDASGNNDGVLFNWSIANPQPTTLMQDDLKINPDTTSETTPFSLSQERVNFLRGNTVNDGIGLTRDRGSRLGDIINSAPLYVAEPNSNWSDDTTFFGSSTHLYSIYQTNQQTTPRDPIIYVGANDGFLHGFSAITGAEVLAYSPSAISSDLNNSGLHYLTESDYLHKYYVDGDVTSADVYIKPSSTASDSWRTVVVGSLRGGGQGIFALDVTDPSSFTNNNAGAASTVLWEFTNQDDVNIGNTFSTPQITMLNNGKWAVIIGNGYNSSGAGTQTAQLMIIFIEEGVDGVWSAGDYIKIDTAIGGPTTPNGLSTPALVDLDNNGTTDRVYAGDLFGNMWAFDLASTSETSWDIAHSGSSPLFAAGSSKPITMKPLIVKPDVSWSPDTVGNLPNIMVYFGTGQYIATGDASNTDQQSFYGIWDTGVSVVTTGLIEQTYVATSVVDAKLLTQHAVLYDPVSPSSGQYGWFIDLNDPGERVVVEAFDLEGLIFFNTLIPSSEPCSAGGSSFFMAVDQKTGGTPTIAAFDFNNNGSLTVADDGLFAGKKFEHGIASKTSVLRTDKGINYGYTSGTDNSSATGVPVEKTILPGSIPPVTGSRQSWIQLIND